MERLTPAPWTPDLPVQVANLLAAKVWNRPAIRPGVAWLFELEDMLQVDVPAWAMPLQYCLCHGDPAMGNVLMRGGQLIIGDPAPRTYLPECAEVDQGKILQSILGWESVAYGTPAPVWEVPAFPKRAAFWCLVSIMRIQWRERRGKERPHVLEWCEHITTGLRDELGV